MDPKTKKLIELKRQHIFLLLQEMDEIEGYDPINYRPELKYRTGEQFRIDRLNNVIGCIHIINPNIIKKITSLEDNEGLLTVFWGERPTSFDKKVVDFAWGINDGATGDNTEHFMNNLVIA
ncbi:MAG TPA: hypothetical protein ACFYD4_07520 [Candidatus Wunengus sp. YC61]|uniref:hypothetical protein n=1 Tax=Candidatus Wunengus sp. YC61 TaxID=3367698 RepID=UPI004027817F